MVFTYAHDDVTDGKNTLETVEKFHEAHGGQQISVAGGIDPEKIRNLNPVNLRFWWWKLHYKPLLTQAKP